MSPTNAPETQVSGFFMLKTAEVLAEILHMSNPGDYYYDESDLDNMDYEIIDLDDEEW